MCYEDFDSLRKLVDKAIQEFEQAHECEEKCVGVYDDSYSSLVAVYEAAEALMDKVDELAYQLTPEYHAWAWVDAHYPGWA